jgi:hypothetical protein
MFPPSKVKTFCVSNDGVCGGELSIGAGHGAYSAESYATEAKNFILKEIGS